MLGNIRTLLKQQIHKHVYSAHKTQTLEMVHRPRMDVYVYQEQRELMVTHAPNVHLGLTNMTQGILYVLTVAQGHILQQHSQQNKLIVWDVQKTHFLQLGVV
jgi:hypothetical protein